MHTSEIYVQRFQSMNHRKVYKFDKALTVNCISPRTATNRAAVHKTIAFSSNTEIDTQDTISTWPSRTLFLGEENIASVNLFTFNVQVKGNHNTSRCENMHLSHTCTDIDCIEQISVCDIFPVHYIKLANAMFFIEKYVMEVYLWPSTRCSTKYIQLLMN